MLLKQCRNLESLVAVFEGTLEATFFIVHVVERLKQMPAGNVVQHVFLEDATPAAVIALEFPPCLMLLHEVLFESSDRLEVFFADRTVEAHHKFFLSWFGQLSLITPRCFVRDIEMNCNMSVEISHEERLIIAEVTVESCLFQMDILNVQL